MPRPRFCFLVFLLLAITTPAMADDAEAINRRLGRGINMGNMLEAPEEGAWGVRVEDRYFPLIRQAGFDSVRIPIRWSAHADQKPPYKIDERFLARVDHVIAQAVAADLAVVVNVHHYEEIFQQPQDQQARLVAIWMQLANHFRDLPEHVCFEILNEPHGELTPELWNELYPQVLKTIRQSDPDRVVIVGPGHWNNVRGLDQLRLPENDRRIIVTVHYYSPHPFTHQGATWSQPVPPVGRVWPETDQEQRELDQDFEKVAAWARQHQRPIYVGEFGAYSRAAQESRVRWTSAVRSAAERHGFSWSYWEFCSGFGAYDPEQDQWRDDILGALLDPSNK